MLTLFANQKPCVVGLVPRMTKVTVRPGRPDPPPVSVAVIPLGAPRTTGLVAACATTAVASFSTVKEEVAVLGWYCASPPKVRHLVGAGGGQQRQGRRRLAVRAGHRHDDRVAEPEHDGLAGQGVAPLASVADTWIDSPYVPDAAAVVMATCDATACAPVVPNTE